MSAWRASAKRQLSQVVRLCLVHPFFSPAILSSFPITYLDPCGLVRHRGVHRSARLNHQPRVGRDNPLRRACLRAPRWARLGPEWPQRSAISLHVNPCMRSSKARRSRLRASMTRG